MKMFNATLNFNTRREGDMIDLTPKIEEIVSKSRIREGIIHLFAPHATGIIILTEYEPRLLEDISDILEDLIPRTKSYKHPVNARSHLRSIFLGPSKTIPILHGEMSLGTWQSIVWIEADTQGRSRRLNIQILGE